MKASFHDRRRQEGASRRGWGKTARGIVSALLLAQLLALCGASSARAATAATYYWDTTAGTTLIGGAGTWDEGTTSNWVSATSGTLTPGTWAYDTVNPTVNDSTSTATNNTASFQTGGTYTVTLGGTIAPTQINVAKSSGGTATNLTLTGGTLNLGSGTNATIFSVDATSSLTVNSNVSIGGYGGVQNNRVSITMAAANLTINGNISQSTTTAATLRVSGNGATTGLTLGGTNTFTGGIDINNVAVTVTNGAALGSGGIGFGYNAATTNTLNANLSTAATFGQTLYMMGVGSNGTITAQITSGGTAAATFTGAMSFSNQLGASSLYAGHGNVSFVLGGTNTGNNTFQGAIINDNSGAGYTTALTKTGTGTWVLTGNNSFTGTTTVSQGTLMISDATGVGLAGTSGITVASGGTLSFGFANQVNTAATLTLSGGTLNLNASGNQTMGTLTLGQSSIIDFGAGSASEKLAFADSSGQSWSGTLTLLDFTVGSDSLNFGSSTGLTAAQLAEINLSGYTATSLDSLGNVVFAAVAVPEPPQWASLLLGAAALGALARVRRKSEANPA